MKKTIFKISKMDCASEESLVRMALDNLEKIEQLSFNIEDRELTVFHDLDSQNILKKLEPLKFGAKIVSTSELNISEEKQLDSDKQKTADQEASESRVLWVLMAINGVMFFAEIIYGFIAQSAGLIADAMDMFADAGVYGISLYAVGRSLSLKRKAARISGYAQMFLALFALSEALRRSFFGSDPEPFSMIYISIIALVANVICLVLINKQKSGGLHMKASAIFSANDVIVNLGVILAAVLVYFSGSKIPDLIIGVVISVVVLRGAITILNLSKEK
jgi:Co/Zn/Cd efflux system component